MYFAKVHAGRDYTIANLRAAWCTVYIQTDEAIMIYEYHKSLLTAQERVAYERILAGISDRKSTVSLGEMDCDRGMETLLYRLLGSPRVVRCEPSTFLQFLHERMAHGK